MFAKFNYKPSNYFYNSELNHYQCLGNSIYSEHEKEVKDCLSEFITEDGIINGTNLKEHWFPISKKDVLISHSHKDINKVKAFAGWLNENFGLEAFIDSCAWGYCDDLLRKIDDKYCYNAKSGTYNYSLRNYTTSHVHMMLSTALTEMIDRTECIIFFNTPNSISMSDELVKITKGDKEITVSPWIYHELLMTAMVRKKCPNRQQVMEHFSHRDSTDRLIIKYDVEKALKNMIDLDDEILKTWKNCFTSRPLHLHKHALDSLYEIVFPKGESQK